MTEQEQEQESGHASERPGDVELSESEVDRIEEERQQRLHPDNRPNNAEVDNTQRDFDQETGEFGDDGDESDLTEDERAVAGDA